MKKKKRKSSKFGIAKFLVMALLLGGGLVYGIQMVQKNQENISKANTVYITKEYEGGTKEICSNLGGKCGDFDNSLKSGGFCEVDLIKGIIYLDLCDGDTTVQCCVPNKK